LPGQIAELLGVHRVTLHGYLRGLYMPRPQMTERIGTLTGGKVTAADLTAAYNRRRTQ
jgi:predicted transcriptional regulator